MFQKIVSALWQSAQRNPKRTATVGIVAILSLCITGYAIGNSSKTTTIQPTATIYQDIPTDTPLPPTATSTITLTSTITFTPTITNTPTDTFTPSMTFTPSITLPAMNGSTCIPNNERLQATLIKVTDGDTIQVKLNGEIVNVRYIGVDTPELSDPGGPAARQANANLLASGKVILIRDVSETDGFSRMLAYVISGNKFVNYELVNKGWAEAKKYPPDIACVGNFFSAQTDAKSAKLGMWKPTPTVAVRLAPILISTNPPSDGGGGGGGGGVCDCGRDYNCSDFSTHSAAQACYVSCGGNNWSGLDRDGDGNACESLP